MRALIVEDEAPAAAKLRRWLAEAADVEIVASVGDGRSAQQAIAALSPDVVFLDIQIPEIDGLSVAEGLGANAPLIVFVTAHDQHAISAFDTDAVDYLLKPYDKQRFVRTLGRVRERLKRRLGASRLSIPVGDTLRFLDTDAIVWLEADGNYVRVHTAAFDYFLRRSLKRVLAQLDLNRFVRVHKSRAVNIAEVTASRALAGGDVELRLRNGASVRMSRRYRSAFDRIQN